MYISFFAILSTRNRDQSIPKIPKEGLQRHLLSDFHQKKIGINSCLGDSKYKIL